MGYEYTIRGWLKCKAPIDLGAVSIGGGVWGYEFSEHDRLEMWVRVTGTRREYVTFATGTKGRSNYYLAAVSALMKAAGGVGSTGLVTVTGEWTYDGKDRFVVARDGELLTVPTVRLYDPLSPWNSIYRWSHYMGRDVEELSRLNSGELGEVLDGRGSVKGWLYLRDWRTTAERGGQELLSEVVRRDSDLEGGVEFMDLYSESYLLVGHEGVDAASVARLMAELTARHNGAYGMLYCSQADEESQVPVAFERGGVQILPEIKLGKTSEPGLLETPAAAYEGMGNGFYAVPLRSGLDLHGLFAAVAQAVEAKPAEPNGGWRERTGVSGPCYLFEARELACVLCANEGQTHTKEHDGWPHLLIAYLRGSAEPEVLARSVGDAVKRLRNAGLEVGADRAWPGLSELESF